MATVVTHRITIKLGDGKKAMAFDAILAGTPDGENITKIIAISEPIPTYFMEDVLAFLKMGQNLNAKYGGVKSLAIMETGYSDPDIKYALTFDQLPQTEKDKYTVK